MLSVFSVNAAGDDMGYSNMGDMGEMGKENIDGGRSRSRMQAREF